MPSASAVDAVAVRYVADGEPHVAVAEIDEEGDDETWWRASFRVLQPCDAVSLAALRRAVGYGWVTGEGLVGHDVPDSDDFVCAVGDDGPGWHVDGVVYQVFPDRFARSGGERTPPDWAVPRDWADTPTGWGPDAPHEWFGGDLGGVEAHLDHLERLGVSILYLTPFFQARSTHRYNATSFDHVDPLLGGDEALVSLVRAAHARGIRVIGDLTINHIGDDHPWFERAAGRRRPRAALLLVRRRGSSTATRRGPASRTLPKLDHRDAAPAPARRRRGRRPALARRRSTSTAGGSTSPTWPGAAATSTSRRARARGARRRARRPADAVLVAEHAHDARSDLQGGGWHGTMAYMGFTRPAWAWLRGDVLPAELQLGFLGLPVEVPRLDGAAVTATMRRFRAGIPWRSVLSLGAARQPRHRAVPGP